MILELINSGSHFQVLFDVVLVSLLDNIILSLYDSMPTREYIHLFVLFADLPLLLCDSEGESLDLTVLL